MPFRYLSLPLSTTHLTYGMCQSLLQKTISRIQHWSSRMLSFVARKQLIDTILLGLQSFWCATFVLPRRILDAITKACRFGVDMPGGVASLWFDGRWFVGLTNLEDSILRRCSGGIKCGLKLLWKAQSVGSSLWATWVQEYYLKHYAIWTVQIRPGQSGTGANF